MISSILIYAQSEYAHNSSVLYEKLYEKINITKNRTTIRGSEAIGPHDLVLILFNYHKSDSIKYEQLYKEYKEMHNATKSFDIDLYRYNVFRAFIYCQNYYILKLPVATKFFIPLL